MTDWDTTTKRVMGELADVRRHFLTLQEEIGDAGALAPVVDTLDAVVSALPDIVYRLDSEGKIVFISDAIGQYGYDPDQLIGCSIFTLIHPADHAKAQHHVNERRRGDRSTRSLELRFLTCDNETVDFELKESATEAPATVNVAAEGVYSSNLPVSESFMYTQGVARDVTARKRVERALSETRGHMALLLERHGEEMKAAHDRLEAEIENSRRREQERAAAERVREEIWRTTRPADLTKVLHVVRDELAALRVEFEWVCLNVVDADEHAHRVHCYRARREGDWGVREETVEDDIVIRLWRAGEPAYRRDLQREDRLGERTALEECYGEPIRSVVDIPFSHGTLAVNSLRAEAFSEAETAFVQELATVLSDGFGRLEDLRELERRAREAEVAASDRQRALVREQTLGRMRDLIIGMRRMRDLPAEDYWVAELNRMGLPVDGISLQFPGSTPDSFVTFFLETRAYSDDTPLARYPWVGEVWESGEAVLVDRDRLESLGLLDWRIQCILEVPLPGEGSLAVSRTREGVLDEGMIPTVKALAGIVDEGLRRARDFEALAAGEARYRSLVEGLPVGVLHVTPRGEILYQNPYVGAMLGYSSQEMAHMRAGDLFAKPEDRQEVVAALDEKGTHSFEYQLRHKSGRKIWVRGTARAVVDSAGKTVEHHGFVEDITDRKLVDSEYHRIEEQLRQAQRMEAMGRLTAGIAHNFNNMLQGITGNLQLALTDSPETLRPLLENADSMARRAGEMVDQLMVFARQGIESSEVEVNLWSVVANTVDLCRRTFDRRIQILAPEPVAEPWVIGDERLLQQVFVNLTLNARDAMSECRDPTLRIAVEAVETGEGEAAARQPPTVGPFVRMSVSDNGVGMDEATRSRIFDPFFTTKPVGQGTGLGLATVYGIVTKHGGWVECESELGKGTTFAVYLPAAVAPSEAAGPADAGKGRSESSDQEAQTGGSRTNGSGTILIIDDEESVRSSTARLLELVGFAVLEAEGGAEGLTIFEAERSRIDLVLLDLSMPRMSGKETLSRLRRIEPDAKVVIITGYSSGEELIEGAAAIVHKPFSIKELTSAIREAVSA